jgi:uncharacterized protein involved in exopolysaccharide biosynthesis
MTTGTPDNLPDAGSDHEAPGPDLRTLFLGGLSRSLGWIVLSTMLGALVGLAIGIGEPNLYVSNAKLLLRVGAREVVSSESMIGSGDVARISAPTMHDEIQMLEDVAIYEKVVRSLGPQQIQRPVDPSREDGPDTPFFVRVLHHFQARAFDEIPADHDCPGASCTTCIGRATQVLMNSTNVEREGDSNVILVSTVSTSPELAQRTVQALVDAFIERHREQFSVQALVEKNRPKVEQAKRDRDAAAIAYVNYVNRTGSDALDPPVPIDVAELNSLEDRLWDAKLELAQLRDQRRSLTERAGDRPAGVTTAGPILMVPNEQYENLLEQKHSLIAERNARPAPSPARAQALDDRIAELDESLSRVPAVVSKAAGRQRSIDPDDVTASLGLQDDEHSLELKIQAITERYQQKKASADEARRKNLMAEQERKDLAANRDSAESRYAQIQDRFSVLEALSAIDLNEDANLRLLQTPTLETEKVGPRRFGLLLKGMLVGLFVGSAFAVTRQKLDSRLRYPSQFERVYGIPVLGVVPQHASLNRLSRLSAGETI